MVMSICAGFTLFNYVFFLFVFNTVLYGVIIVIFNFIVFAFCLYIFFVKHLEAFLRYFCAITSASLLLLLL